MANESFAELLFIQHLAGGISWAAGLSKDDCGGTDDQKFQKVVLDDDVASPMGLQVAPDGRVYCIERNGLVRGIDPVTSVTRTVGQLPVHTGQENGLLASSSTPTSRPTAGCTSTIRRRTRSSLSLTSASRASRS